jgi:hypothetical protein
MKLRKSTALRLSEDLRKYNAGFVPRERKKSIL